MRYNINLALLWLLSLADALFTLNLVLSDGVSVEGNPLMRSLLLFSPFVFVVVKMAMTSLAVGVLYHTRHYRLSRLSSHALVLLYALMVTANVYCLVSTS